MFELDGRFGSAEIFLNIAKFCNDLTMVCIVLVD